MGIDLSKIFEKIEVIDLSVMVGNEWPCNWPTIMGFHTSDWNKHDSWRGDFHTRYMIMEEHTGTHMVAPNAGVSAAAPETIWLTNCETCSGMLSLNG